MTDDTNRGRGDEQLYQTVLEFVRDYIRYFNADADAHAGELTAILCQDDPERAAEYLWQQRLGTAFMGQLAVRILRSHTPAGTEPPALPRTAAEEQLVVHGNRLLRSILAILLSHWFYAECAQQPLTLTTGIEQLLNLKQRLASASQ